MNARPIMIMAGGTGGHVYPALAVANALRERSRRVVWLGTHRGLEARVVPAAGIEIELDEGVGGKSGLRRVLGEEPHDLVRIRRPEPGSGEHLLLVRAQGSHRLVSGELLPQLPD